MTLALCKVAEVWAGMEAQSQQPIIGNVNSLWSDEGPFQRMKLPVLCTIQ